MTIYRLHQLTITFLAFELLSSTTSLYTSDSVKPQQTSLYFAVNDQTLKEADFLPNLLAKHMLLEAKDFVIENYQGEVSLITSDKISIPIQLSGYSILPTDTIYTSAASRAIIKINENTYLSLSEKTLVQFNKVNERIYIKILEGNVRLKTHGVIASNIILESSEFIVQIEIDDCAISVSKKEGSTFFSLAGEQTITINKESATSQIVERNNLITNLKNGLLKKTLINSYHKDFITSNLSFELKNQKTNFKNIYNLIFNAPIGLITRCSLDNLNTKEKQTILEEINKYFLTKNTALNFNAFESKALSSLVLLNGKTIKLTVNQSNEKMTRDALLEKQQKELQIKAQLLKEEEKRLLQEAQEAEEKLNKIK